ncbi:N-acetylmuramoyl-L-alanine amidase (plasmid) [Psychrobacillus glaciei]|uniref:N-acetylmuramoyl-L-alanine amidase n=1 Tax=Psychrobacillus glaciei TaxID=2283160 RepID=A0A5J6SUL6_9BACI|nr:N-acetylmuramoyl-L-alanine amidase [Psychrobacillus glaciei]QFG01300.1 N-acetylmuramoyl-L-alanine amidase [Psychrobacillus glaciei]
MLDYGHGGSDPGAVYKNRKEANDNLILGQAVAKLLRAAGIQVDETRTTDKTMSLIERSNAEKKKKYDYFISFHRNAFQPEKAAGVETFIFSMDNSKSKGLATAIQNSIVQCGFVDRGVKTANYHVLEKTNSAALLLEVGFIDNTSDNKLFDSKFDTIAKMIAEAIILNFGIKTLEYCIKCGQKVLNN